MEEMLSFFRKYHKYIIAGIILLSLPLIYVFVYFTGGIKYVYSHTMYIPILLAGIFFGWQGGILIALIGGFLLGPIMPLDVELQLYQDTLNWIYRLLTFLMIGGLSGYSAQKLRKTNKENIQLFSHHVETNIPNINHLYALDDDYINEGCLVSTIHINNKEHIIEVLGLDFYHRAMSELYKILVEILPKPNCVIQAENDKIWTVSPSKFGLKDKQQILDLTMKEIIISDIKIYLDYAIGIAYVLSFREVKKLNIFKDTDKLAMFARNNNLPYAVYDKHTFKEKYQFDLLSLFQDALNQDETYMVYQPVISPKGKIKGFESLIRWQNHIYGLIMPNDFIPLVESTQLIHKMTDWVIRKVIRKQNELSSKGHDVLISINLSVKNLYDEGFANRVQKIIKEEKGDPTQIIFEITETMLLKDNPTVKKTLELLKSVGFKIAIDDFGKGYSSMSYLCQYPADYIKIDRYFLNDIEANKSMYEIVLAMVNLAHQLQLEVVAEGIETKAVMDIVQSMTCDYVQGYYFAKPMPADEMIDFIEQYEKR